MPLIIVCHHPNEPRKNLDRFNQAVRARIVEAAKALGEYPDKLSGGTTKDMFGTVFHTDPVSDVVLGELEIRGYFNPRSQRAKEAYEQAANKAAEDAGFEQGLFWSDTPIVEVTIWDIYPEDNPVYDEPATP
jgi:hypothetical protein